MDVKAIIAQAEDSGFGINHLPYGSGNKLSENSNHILVRISDYCLSLTELEIRGYFQNLLTEPLFSTEYLNTFMEAGISVWDSVRDRLSSDLQKKEIPQVLRDSFYPLSSFRLQLPVKVGDYTDFYASKAHATKVGRLFRGEENALHPNWDKMPIAYHGRSSSIIESGDPIYRPKGQILIDGNPVLDFTQQLDFELEIGFFTGKANSRGSIINISDAENHIFGFSLVNDWSARDIQRWEYVPLGPFLGKSFATTISHWITPIQALYPFRCKNPNQHTHTLDYLKLQNESHFDITFEVLVNGYTISHSKFEELYWSPSQMLAHHTINGCPINAGDLLASGTISGWRENEYGCLLEKNEAGKTPLTFENMERIWLEDGDEVSLKAYCKNKDAYLVFGEVTGQIQKYIS